MDVTAYEREADVNNHFYYVDFKDMKLANYKFAGPHIHHSIEIVVCYGGKMAAKINNRDFLLNKGDVLLINPLDWHYYEYIDNASCFILVIANEFTDDILVDQEKELNNKISFNETEFSELFSLINRNITEFDNMSFLRKKSFVLSMFSLMESKGLYKEKLDLPDREICKKIICYIEEHLTEKLTIETVAKEFGYSRNYFSYLFNRLIGENFNHFVNRYRISKVNQLKNENKDMLIEDAIFKAGFTSRETYYRYIRKGA